MYNKALAVLKILNDNGYLAYIVGGYPRDMILGVPSQDIDICTSAKPKEIIAIFDTDKVNDVSYGSIRIIYKNALFDVTTFRKDIKYENNRKPIKIKYVNDLRKDLLRRDFTVNTICIDAEGKIIDLLGAHEDLEKHLLKMVGNPRHKLKEDSLRILRAVRFASNLDFTIDDKTKYYIKKYAYLLTKLSSSRKREELDKILTSRNKEKGRDLLVVFGLDKYLGLNNLKDIILCDDILGIWSQIETTVDYPFSKLERETIKKIKEMSELGVTNLTVYKYGLYISNVVASIKGVSYRDVNNIYKKLSIKSIKDIVVTGMEIANILKKEPGNYIGNILSDLEEKIVEGKLENEKDKLYAYVKENY